MPLSWNEIRNRAHEFSKRWENETSEDAEAKSFRSEFFGVFGIDRKRVAFLFERYQQLTSMLPVATAKPNRKKKAAL